VVHGDESPVGDYAGNVEGAVCVGTSDEIFDCSRIEKLDVGEGKNLERE